MGSNSIDKFPAPYVDSIREDDPIVVRVDQDFGEIGSRPKTAPREMMTSRMEIEHVGSGVAGSRSNNNTNK
jgi:hypothetical protein